MGNWSNLYASNHPVKPHRGLAAEPDAPSLTIKYALPVVWLALFGADDVQVYCEIDDPDSLQVHLASPKAAALARLRSRRAWLLRRFPRLAPAALAQFEAVFADAPFGWVHLESDDVASMSISMEGWASELPVILGMFEEAEAAPVAPPPAARTSLLARLFGRSPAPAPASRGWDLYWKTFRETDLDESSTEMARFLGYAATGAEMPWGAD